MPTSTLGRKLIAAQKRVKSKVPRKPSTTELRTGSSAAALYTARLGISKVVDGLVAYSVKNQENNNSKDILGLIDSLSKV